jgi:hypothetical protein
VCAVAATSAAAAQAPPPIKVTVAKHEAGPYTQDVGQVTVGGAARSFYFKLANKTDHTQDVTLEDRSTADAPANVKFRWFRGDENITDDALGSGYAFKLKPGSPKVFRGQVKPLVDDPGEICLFSAFKAQPDDVEIYGLVYINSTSICG